MRDALQKTLVRLAPTWAKATANGPLQSIPGLDDPSYQAITSGVRPLLESVRSVHPSPDAFRHAVSERAATTRDKGAIPQVGLWPVSCDLWENPNAPTDSAALARAQWSVALTRLQRDPWLALAFLYRNRRDLFDAIVSGDRPAPVSPAKAEPSAATTPRAREKQPSVAAKAHAEAKRLNDRKDAVALANAMGVRKAAKHLRIPRSTLSDWKKAEESELKLPPPDRTDDASEDR